GPIVEIDFADAIELSHAEEDAVSQRQGSARERGTGSSRHDLDAALEAEPQHLADLRGRIRQHNHHWHLPVGGQAIGFVCPHFALAGNNAFTGNDRAQCSYDVASAREQSFVHRRQPKAHRRPSILKRLLVRIQFSTYSATTNPASLVSMPQLRPSGTRRARCELSPFPSLLLHLVLPHLGLRTLRRASRYSGGSAWPATMWAQGRRQSLALHSTALTGARRVLWKATTIRKQTSRQESCGTMRPFPPTSARPCRRYRAPR